MNKSTKTIDENHIKSNEELIMFDFKKICTTVENLSEEERAALIMVEGKHVYDGLSELPFTAYNPVDALTVFIIGAIVSDGVLDETEYSMILPSLERAFGKNVDYESLKSAFKSKRAIEKIDEYVSALMKIVSAKNEDLVSDIVTLCLLVVSIDGKVTPKERRYVRRLCK